MTNELVEKLGTIVTEILLAHEDGVYDSGIEHARTINEAMRILSTPSQPSQPASVLAEVQAMLRDLRTDAHASLTHEQDTVLFSAIMRLGPLSAAASVQTMGDPVAYRYRMKNREHRPWHYAELPPLPDTAHLYDVEPLYISAPTLTGDMVMVPREDAKVAAYYLPEIAEAGRTDSWKAARATESFKAVLSAPGGKV